MIRSFGEANVVWCIRRSRPMTCRHLFMSVERCANKWWICPTSKNSHVQPSYIITYDSHIYICLFFKNTYEAESGFLGFFRFEAHNPCLIQNEKELTGPETEPVSPIGPEKIRPSRANRARFARSCKQSKDASKQPRIEGDEIGLCLFWRLPKGSRIP